MGTVSLGLEHDNTQNTDNDSPRWMTIDYLAFNNTIARHPSQINPPFENELLKYTNKYTCKTEAGTEGSKYLFDNENLNAEINLPVACGSCMAASAD